MVEEDLSDAPCLKFCGTRCIDICCFGLLGIPIWGIVYLVRGGRAYIGALMIVIPMIFIIISFVFISRMQKDEEVDGGEYKVGAVIPRDTSISMSWRERRDARKMKKFDEGVARTYEKLMERERYHMNRFQIYASCLEKALGETIMESEVGKEIQLKTLALIVRNKATQIHKEKYPGFDIPDFSSIEIRVEERIVEGLDLRKLIGHYDAKKKIFTPLTLDLLIEREKHNTTKNSN